MWLLALDTSGKTGSLALLKDGQLKEEINWVPASSHTSELPFQFEKILSQATLSIKEIDAYALTIGPGSFTGLRVGLSFIKGIACLSETPVMGVSTLEALAAADEKQEWICPLVDARQSEVYAAVYQRKEKNLEILIPESAYDPKEFLKLLAAQKIKGSLSFLGSGARVYAELIHQHFPNQALFLDPSLDAPQASKVGEIAFQQFQKGNFSKGGIDLLPNYLRLSVAEKKRIKNLE